jgi:hypothetical protein
VFSKSSWLEKNLAEIGIWMFLVGVLCLLIGVVFQLFPLTKGVVTVWSYIAAVVRYIAIGLDEPLIFNGVVLYLLGRIAGTWTVSIVGFEQGEQDGLRFRGPDNNHTVWVGRTYRSKPEAAAAADAIVRRGATKGV